LQLLTSLAKTWILNESFSSKWHKVQIVTSVVGDFIIKKWKRQSICLWQEDFFWTLRDKIGGDEANLVKCLNRTAFTTIS